MTIKCKADAINKFYFYLPTTKAQYQTVIKEKKVKTKTQVGYSSQVYPIRSVYIIDPSFTMLLLLPGD